MATPLPSSDPSLSSVFRNRKVNFEHILTQDLGMERAIRMAEKAATSPNAILLRGEPGTGKSLLAQAIHNASLRKSEPCVIIGPGDVSGDKVRERLFGTTEILGLIPQGDRGTLIFDDLQEWPMETQIILEQFVDFREYQLAPDESPRHVDVRFITIMTGGSSSGASSGVSESLYQRLRGVEILLPSLAERPNDIPLLVKKFLTRVNRSTPGPAIQITEQTMNLLKQRRWFGNVRELEHSVRSAAISMGESRNIEPQHLPSALEPALDSDSLPYRVDDLEAWAYQRALDSSLGNRKKAIQMLGVSSATFYRKARSFGLLNEKEGHQAVQEAPESKGLN